MAQYRVISVQLAGHKSS